MKKKSPETGRGSGGILPFQPSVLRENLAERLGGSDDRDGSLLWIRIKPRNGVCYATVTQINFGEEMKTAPQGSRQRYGKKGLFLLK